MIHQLERTGHLMVNVAKATRRLHSHGLDPKLRGLLERMGTQACLQLRLAVDALRDGHLDKASAVEDMDDFMDDLTKSLFRSIFAGRSVDESSLQQAVQKALIGRYYERAADHAVNVSHRVRFLVTGTICGDEPTEEIA